MKYAAAIGMIYANANADSSSRVNRVFSCTEMCTGVIKDQVFNGKQFTGCDVLKMCENPENECLKSGGVFSKIKGRKEKVEAAISAFKARNACTISGPIPGPIRPQPPRNDQQLPPQNRPQAQPQGRPAMEVQPIAQRSQFPNVPSIPESETIVILSVDGGGVRGIVPGVLVDQMEQSLGGRKISEVVDVFAGTSAGSILVSLLNIPEDPNAPAGQRVAKNTAAQALELSDIAISKIFDTSGPRKYRVLFGLLGSRYSNKPLMQLIKEEAGVATKMNQLVKPTLITTVDLGTHQPFYFDSNIDNSTLFTWEAVLASSSAPTYFKPYPLILPDGSVKKLTDGGLVSNSPQLEALLYAMDLYPNRRYLLISLATGGTVVKEQVAAKGATAGSIPKILGKTVETLLDSQAGKSTRVINLLAKNPQLKIDFVRIDVTLPKECSSTDDASDGNIKCLKDAADNVSKSLKFQNMISKLKEAKGVN